MGSRKSGGGSGGVCVGGRCVCVVRGGVEWGWGAGGRWRDLGKAKQHGRLGPGAAQQRPEPRRPALRGVCTTPYGRAPMRPAGWQKASHAASNILGISEVYPRHILGILSLGIHRYLALPRAGWAARRRPQPPTRLCW